MHTKTTQNGFKIKLLSGKNVVLVEYPNYDSEIFMPKICNGILTFQNIVPSRRCCKKSADNTVESRQNNFKQSVPHEHSHAQNLKLGSAMSFRTKNTPGENAKSQKRVLSVGAKCTSREPSQSFDEAKENTLGQLRSMSTHQREHQISNIELPNYDVVNADQTVTSTPIKITATKRKSCVLKNNSLNNSGFNLPNTPDIDSKNACLFVTPKSNASQIPKSITPLLSKDKWRKCITPVRTYSTNNKKKESFKTTTLKNLSKEVVPTYLANPTQGKPGTHELPIKKHKLKVDEKIVLTPKVQKHFRSPFKPKLHPKSHKALPLNLLTQANRRVLAKPLQRQFKSACVDKTSTTHPKYKLLAMHPSSPIITINNAQ